MIQLKSLPKSYQRFAVSRKERNIQAQIDQLRLLSNLLIATLDTIVVADTKVFDKSFFLTELKDVYDKTFNITSNCTITKY